jgi:TRAP-type C4-dicarboxylate transport system permease small subunit
MLWRAYDAITTAFLALAGAVMFALAIGNALLRYLFNSPLVWGEEISRYAMIWGTMIGVALAYRAGHHVAIAVFADALPRRAAQPLRILAHLLTLSAALLLLRTGWALMAMLGPLEAPSSGIRMTWVYAAIPVGAVLLAIEALRLLAADVGAAVRRGRLASGPTR